MEPLEGKKFNRGDRKPKGLKQGREVGMVGEGDLVAVGAGRGSLGSGCNTGS
jgi:hypothetical protein